MHDFQKKALPLQPRKNNSKYMLDFYFAIHYVLYRYYMRKEFGSFLSVTTACSFLASIFGLLLISVVGLFLKLTNAPIDIGNSFIIISLFVFGVIEYLIIYRNGAYLDVFGDYEDRLDTPTMKRKCRYAKIFNICVIVLDIICLSVIDYINNH